MKQADVAAKAVVTVKTYGRIESGEPVRDTTYGKVDPVLDWASGSCLDVLNGGNPTPIEKSSMPGVVFSPISEGDLVVEQGALEQAVQDAAVAVGGQLTADGINELKRRVVELVRSRSGPPEKSQD